MLRVMVFTRPRVVTRPEPRRQPEGSAHAPARTHSGPLIASPAGLLHIQQTAGNAATIALLQRQPEGPGTIPGMEPASPGPGSPTASPARPILRYGSTGEDVKQLQMKLRNVKEREHDRDVTGKARIDGIFGPLTKQDVIDFQGDTGLDADGIVGPKTWDALDSLVPETPNEGEEAASDERFSAAVELTEAGQYDAALVIFEERIAAATTPERIAPSAINAGICHQQRGRFGLAVGRYEQALPARFNQESKRAKVLEMLAKARRGVFLDSLPPDPEPLPPGADPATVAGREGGGVTERQPARSGDSGSAVDLYKGKLAHMMVGWPPSMPAGDVFDAPTLERTRAFQEACGLEQTGEADASTWHALDSFTKADVPFSVLRPHWDRNEEAVLVGVTDAAASLSLLEANRDEGLALGLTEDVKATEAQIGERHHRLSHFPEAVEHYTLYLDRNIPHRVQYGTFLEALRRAHQGLPLE
jgi:peptidoglycan hydrolase-like protein with peptidoglycan-binding domain